MTNNTLDLRKDIGWPLEELDHLIGQALVKSLRRLRLNGDTQATAGVTHERLGGGRYSFCHCPRRSKKTYIPAGI